jgi:U32 family peptidase
MKNFTRNVKLWYNLNVIKEGDVSMRYFNQQKIELLAPAGTFEIFQAIVKTKCDAIYLGGQKLNMRMIRPGYNLSNEEIVEAVKIAHEHDKLLYVTVNNLNNAEDLKEAREYLQFLNDEAKPDGIIVADMAIVQLVKELNLKLEIHSSVMMNVHNTETIKALEKIGVTRVVVSRDFTLADVRRFKDTVPNMEIEYFTHGDMCSVHGSQCYYSSLLFGMSSNRGRCLKPCRWWYKMKQDGKVYDPKFPLAAKDMCMYAYLPEMIEAGVNSFKIEGRMRQKEFIVDLINYYGDALDRYIADPIHYDREKHLDALYENRKRDLSTCYAFGKPGLKNINLRYEGTGKIYSTGKMFSKPTEEKTISNDKILKIKELCESLEARPKPLTLAVKVNNVEQAKLCIKKGVDLIHLSGNVYLPDRPFSIDAIKELSQLKGSSKLILGTPKIMDDFDFSRYSHVFNQNDLGIDGISVSNYGALSYLKQFDYPLYGDYAFNLYNPDAVNFYYQKGLEQATLSVELPYQDLVHTIYHAKARTELIVHGLLDVMHLEHDLFENLSVCEVEGEADNTYVDNSVLVLFNESGEYPVYKDERGRNHLHNTKELNLSSVVKGLNRIGLSTIRIEGQTYTTEQLATLIDYYQQIINDDIKMEIKPYYQGFTLGAHQF